MHSISGPDAAADLLSPTERRARRVANARSDGVLSAIAFVALWIAPGFLLRFPLPPSGVSLGDGIDPSGAFWSGLTFVFHVLALAMLVLGALRLGYVYLTRNR